MRSQTPRNRHNVFINVPFDEGYEPLFVALIAGLVAVGRTPRCVVEIPEQGDGRLTRIFNLIRSCSVSIHDLSRVNMPVRFNMPFELGIAFALRRIENHKFVVFEAERYRLQRTLSDLNGIDPGIHAGTANGVISCVLSSLARPNTNPDPTQVEKLYRQLWKVVPDLKRSFNGKRIYSRAIFQELVAGAAKLAIKQAIIS